MIWCNSETNVYSCEASFGNIKGSRIFLVKFIRFINRMLSTYSTIMLKNGQKVNCLLFRNGMFNPFYWQVKYLNLIQTEEEKLDEYEITDEMGMTSKICEKNKIVIFRNNKLFALTPDQITTDDKKVIIFSDTKFMKLGSLSSPSFRKKGYNYIRSIVDIEKMSEKNIQDIMKSLYIKRILVKRNDEQKTMDIIDRYRFRYVKRENKKNVEKEMYLLDIKEIKKIDKKRKFVKFDFLKDQLFLRNESVFHYILPGILRENKELFKDYHYDKYDSNNNGLPVTVREIHNGYVRKYKISYSFLKDKFFNLPNNTNEDKIRFVVRKKNEKTNT